MLAKNAVPAEYEKISVIMMRMSASPVAVVVLIAPLAIGLFFRSGWSASAFLSMRSLII